LLTGSHNLNSARPAVRQHADTETILNVRNLEVTFHTPEAIVRAVSGVSFSLGMGEVLGILGESGSGKSVTLRALMRLLPPKKTKIEGQIEIGGRDVLRLDSAGLARLRGPVVAMVFQEPMTALDPVYTIGEQLRETIAAHEPVTRTAAKQRALELLEMVQIPSARRRLDAYSHELSGGLRQRAMIALALAARPALLLADEPTTALDATVQIQVLLLLRSLQRDLGMAMIFVTHDLGVAMEVSHRIAVMYAGRFVETGSAPDVVRGPAHPYTEGLLGSLVHKVAKGERLASIPGAPPDLSALPEGCSFAPRCRYAVQPCTTSLPGEFPVAGGGTDGDAHIVRCIRHASPAVLAQHSGLTQSS
jgi:peptide/nickel transport system ATP-binding protein